MPWEWAELIDRASVTEIRKVIAGAIWREARARDGHGLHALQTGQWKEGTTLRDVLGRDPLALVVPATATEPPIAIHFGDGDEPDIDDEVSEEIHAEREATRDWLRAAQEERAANLRRGSEVA